MMKNNKFKKKLGLKIETTDDLEEDFNNPQKEENNRKQEIEKELNTSNNRESKSNGNTNTDLIDIGKTFTLNEKRPEIEKSTDLELIKFAMNSSLKDSDLSFQWYKRIDDLAYIAKPIQIKNTKELQEPIKRDIGCEFKLIKLLTDDKQHKANFVDLPKNLKRTLNRYNDILPCKLLIII